MIPAWFRRHYMLPRPLRPRYANPSQSESPLRSLERYKDILYLNTEPSPVFGSLGVLLWCKCVRTEISLHVNLAQSTQMQALQLHPIMLMLLSLKGTLLTVVVVMQTHMAFIIFISLLTYTLTPNERPVNSLLTLQANTLNFWDGC